MRTSSNPIDASPDSVNALDLALELSSQPNRTALTHHFASILSRLYRHSRVFIYGADNSRKIESHRQRSLGDLLLRNLLQPVSTAEVLKVKDLDGAMKCLEHKISQEVDTHSNTTRLIHPIWDEGVFVIF